MMPYRTKTVELADNKGRVIFVINPKTNNIVEWCATYPKYKIAENKEEIVNIKVRHIGISNIVNTDWTFSELLSKNEAIRNDIENDLEMVFNRVCNTNYKIEFGKHASSRVYSKLNFTTKGAKDADATPLPFNPISHHEIDGAKIDISYSAVTKTMTSLEITRISQQSVGWKTSCFEGGYDINIPGVEIRAGGMDLEWSNKAPDPKLIIAKALQDFQERLSTAEIAETPYVEPQYVNAPEARIFDAKPSFYYKSDLYTITKDQWDGVLSVEKKGEGVSYCYGETISPVNRRLEMSFGVRDDVFLAKQEAKQIIRGDHE